MARVLMTFVGLAILGLGLWASIAWWEVAVKPFLMALVAVTAVLVGLVVTILGLSELAGSRSARRPSPPAEFTDGDS